MNYKNLGEPFKHGKSTLYNCDCMELLKQTPDNYYQLCITDPPYGIGIAKKGTIGRKEHKNKKTYKSIKRKDYGCHEWDKKKPESEYFKELFRVSKNQIIWGGNYFIENLYPTSCFIIWDKENGKTFFADCELAWSSFTSVTKIFRYNYNGCWENNKFRTYEKIHPTQKPVKLYRWLLENYAKPGDKILDTHAGSMSIAIACHYLGFDLTASELDKDYYKAAMKRIKEETAQISMF